MSFSTMNTHTDSDEETDNSKHIINIFILTESRKKIPVRPEDKVRKLFDDICDRLSLKQRQFFAIAEQLIDEHNAPFDRFLDFQNTIAEENLNPKSILCFKVKHMKKPREITDPVAEELLFKQVQQNIIQEIYPCPERIACVLASYELQEKYGDYDPRKHRIGYLNKVGLSVFLPRTVSRHDYAYWQERLFALHKKLNGVSRRDAMKKYIEIARQIPYFGMTFFELTDDVGVGLLIGVAEDGLFLFNSQNLNLLHCVTYKSLIAWTKRDNGFDIMFEEGDDVQTLSLITTPVKRKEILDLLDEYYALLPDDWRDSMKKPNNSKPVVLDRPFDYLPPQKRVFLGRFGSRLEYLKGYYMESCAMAKMVPIRKFCSQIDNCIDRDASLQTLDLTDCEIDNQRLEFVTRSIMKALVFQHETAFSWKENLELQEFLFGENNILIDKASNLIEMFSHPRFEKLKRIDLSRNLIDNTGAITLSSILSKMQFIEVLQFNGCNIGNKGAVSICEATRGKNNFSVLELADNRIDDRTMTYLGKYLENNRILIKLNLSGNKIESKGIELILKALESDRRLETLDISNLHFSNKGGFRLAAFLESNKGVRYLNASGNKFCADSFARIGQALKANATLSTLDLSNNVLGTKMDAKLAKDACEFLGYGMSQVKEIMLSNNGLDATFAEEFAKSIRINNKLTKIVLSGNPLTRSGALPPTWKDAFVTCQVRHLNLARCSIQGSGFKDLLSSITNEMDELILDGNDPQVEDRNLSIFFLSCKVKKLSMNDLKLSDDAITNAATAIGRNKVLEELLLNDNLLTRDGVERLINGLKNNRHLRELSIRNNRFNGESKIVTKALLERTSLEKVFI